MFLARGPSGGGGVRRSDEPAGRAIASGLAVGFVLVELTQAERGRFVGVVVKLDGAGFGGAVVVGSGPLGSFGGEGVGLEERFDGVHFFADGVEGGVEVSRGAAERSALEDACGGDASSGGVPEVSVLHDVGEAWVEEALDDLSDASSDGAWRGAGESGDLDGVHVVGVDGFEELSVFRRGPVGAGEYEVGEFSSSFASEVGGEVGVGRSDCLAVGAAPRVCVRIHLVPTNLCMVDVELVGSV